MPGSRKLYEEGNNITNEVNLGNILPGLFVATHFQGRLYHALRPPLNFLAPCSSASFQLTYSILIFL